MIRADHIEARTGGGRIAILLLVSLSILGAASSANAQACSDFGGVLDGFAGDVPPSQLQIDQNCTIRNYPASNPLDTNFSFFTQPGQTDERWLVVFDNVVHTGQMSCNATHEHKIWFTNGSSTRIRDRCQNLLIPVEKIDKQNPAGETTAAVGVPFTYTLTMPVLFDPATGSVINTSGSVNDLHGITLVDDLNETGVDLTYVSHTATWRGSGAAVPHTFSNVGGVLTFDNFPIVPAGEQIDLQITVVLEDTPVNAPGTQFINIARWDFGRLIDGEFFEPLPGEWGISDPLTIAAPDLVMTKTGPASLGLTLNLGQFGEFFLDVQNTGLGDAWNITILDQLPDGGTGGMCDTVPEVLSAQVFEADGTTPVSGPLLEGTDYSLSYTGAPTCELVFSVLSDVGTVGPSERLIVRYRTKLDADTQDGVSLTNVSGAVEWFNGDPGNPSRVGFVRTLTDGTVGLADHEDAHTVTAALFGFFFEKSVENLTSGVSPSASASPGDVLRYTLRFQATDAPLADLRFFDVLGALNASPVFVPGSLALVAATLPPGADVTNTDPNGGPNGAGIVDVRNLSVAANSEIRVQFDITVDPGLLDGTLILNQSDLFSTNVDIADSDDPNVNGQADPSVPGDEDPTQVLIARLPVGPLLKTNTQATASVGESFSYRVTVPETPYPYDVFDVRITDDLSVSAADLRFVSVTRIAGSGAWVPVNTGNDTAIVIEDPGIGIDVPAGEQVEVEITVVLEDTPTNVAGLSFTNTASFTYDTIDGDPASQLDGDPGTSPPMTVVEPVLTLAKSGPATMTIGTPETFTLDVQNAGGGPAWNATLTDLLPDGPTGGTCDTAPANVSAQVFEADGTTPVSGVLAQGVDFAVSYSGPPGCLFTLSLLGNQGTIGPGQRLIVSYDIQLDADTQNVVTLTNVAGAVEWFSFDAASADRRTHTEVVTDGSVGVVDHEDAHTVTVALPNFVFEKTVENLTSGANPAATASPGDVLRYTLRLANASAVPLPDLAFIDDLGSLNPSAVFVPGSLSFFSVPAGADTSGTDPLGGSNGTGLLDVRNLSLAGVGEISIVFDVTLAAVIANATIATNQSSLELAGAPFAQSDDPNLNGPADPDVAGDEDPTRVVIQSLPDFRVEKISTDLTGDPNVLLPGETLRYTISVVNVGNAGAVDAALRDAVPANTSYLLSSTRLNGVPVPDAPGSPLAAGILINPPGGTPGTMPADPTADPSNVATVVFDVVVDANVVDGTIISNQAFVSSVAGGVVDVPSDDPDTPIRDDPTRDVVGSLPLLFAAKDAVLLADAGSPGVVDPGDSLRYTISVHNSGTVPATAVSLQDALPAGTTYLLGTTTLNTLPVPDGGAFPLTGGLAISSSDLTPPLPAPGAGVISPGETATLVFDLQVVGAPGSLIVNQALVTSGESPDLPTDGDGNPGTGPEPTVVVVGPGQRLSISKQVAVVGGGPVLPGSTLEYLVQATNIATVSAQQVVFTDDLDADTPGELAYGAGSATLNGVAGGITVVGSLITANYGAVFGPLAPGATASLRFRATVNGAATNGTPVTNTGVVTWNNPPQNASASVSVQVGGTPGVGVLAGSLWHDADFDQIRGPLERALVGWTVELFRGAQLLLTVTSDSRGDYSIGGLAANDTGGLPYRLRFTAPSAGAATAALGVADSPFTNVLQEISDIVVASGASLQGLNLPIDPNGVVYGALPRSPVAGATLTLLDASSRTPVPGTCFADRVQQGQVTGVDGYYKFSLTFGAGCPSPGTYEIAVTPPGSGFASTPSQLIPPTSDPASPLSVPTCPGGAADAIAATAQFCEAQISPFAPGAADATTYYLHLTLDASQVPGSSQIFNNHIPLDPALGAAVALTKTTPSVNVSRGDLVPYEIVVRNTLATPLPTLGIVDDFPAGFRYVAGSAQVDGVPIEPLVSGQQLVWNDLGIDENETRILALLLAVGAGVGEGEFTNRAQAFDGNSGAGLSIVGQATVRVIPDITFSCTDIFGKVFDDADHDGIQDEGERGLAGVRLMTVRGLRVTTDAHGRYHITCALVPREDRGSNFLLKLDDRTLPAGYRMTTRPLQVQRATRGKALKINFGAAIHRVVGLDLVDAVFEPGSTKMRMQWKPRLELLLEELERQESILRLSYVADIESPGLVDERVEAVRDWIVEAWKERDAYTLKIETEIFWRRGKPSTSPAGLFDSSAVDVLPPVGAGPPVVDSEPGASAERHLPIDEPFSTWTHDPERIEADLGDRLEEQEVLKERTRTVKLRNVIPAIRFESGKANIPASSVERLRSLLDSMRHLRNVRLHLVGHADDQPLSPQLAAIYGDNEGLSRERSGEVAEFLQQAFELPPESISYAWAGTSEPIATNLTEEGRARNRRVEVEVWHDEVDEETVVEETVVLEDFKRIKICRTETVCQLRYREGHARRTRVRNLVEPLRWDEGRVELTETFVAGIREALENLSDQHGVTVRLIGFTDDSVLAQRDERIYGTHLAFSKALSRRLALELVERLSLPSGTVESDGGGVTRPVASNATERGRALNRRVEVEFWYDDPLQELPAEPQVCPDAADAATVTRVYDPPWGRIAPLPVVDGEILVPEGYGDVLSRAMADVAHEQNVRLRFVGYTANERLDRRTAVVYGDDIGLSVARARRAKERIRADLGLSEAQAEHEGRGFVHSNDVVNGGFIQGDSDQVVVQVVYDELALLDDYEGVEVTPITRERKPEDPLALNLMRITVDGVPIDDPGRSLADIQRCTDVALEDADVRFRFDDLSATPRLSVAAAPTSVRVAPAGGAPSRVVFQAYSNYLPFIERSEVRIFRPESSLRAQPLAVVELDADGQGTWEVDVDPFAAPVDELRFVLRAYDAEGRFDQTRPQALWLIHGEPEPISAVIAPALTDPEREVDESVADPPRADAGEHFPTPADARADAERRALLEAYGETHPISRNIPLDNAGMVTVHGSEVPPGHSVWVAGARVPVDEHGNFVAETILPPGMHTVEVAVLDEEGNGELFLRDLEFERSDWFYMGIADLTVSGRSTSGPADLLEGENASVDPDSNVDGRIAFYVDGKFGDDWRLTASADTREEPVEDLFSNFLDKSPDALLRRIDPDYFQPTFGDDSTVEETAPTLGKFYVKLAKDESHAMWGDFKVSYLGNELAQVDRGLYGGNLHYQTEATTSFGEQRLQVDGFAADPGTVPSRQDFQGTGGSLYFLRHQDILIGSDRLRVEVRDKDTGLVTRVVHLRYGLDYDIDYFQGRVLLNEPLSTTVADDLLVRSSGLSGNEAWLVVQYEFTPGLEEIDTLLTGGNGEAWLTDFLRLGVVANRNAQDGVDSSLYGADVTLRASTDSWLKLQGGRSEGLVSDALISSDGGFDFDNTGSPGVAESDDAFAYRVDASLGLGDLVPGVAGNLGGYFQRLEENYTAPGQLALTDTDYAGGFLDLPMHFGLRLHGKADWFKQALGVERQTQEVDLGYRLAGHWTLSAGVRNDVRKDDSLVVPVTQEVGGRTDGVVQLGLDSLGNWSTYAFGQGTLRSTGSRSQNNRGGIGGSYRLLDWLSLDGEVSYGDLGLAATVGTSYQQSERTRLYLTYALENERAINGDFARQGNLVTGARTRFSDSGSIFVENRYQHAGTRGLTRALGVDFAPADGFSVSVNWESGEIFDRLTDAETMRRAGGLIFGYRQERFSLSSGVEYRFDDTEQPDGAFSDRTTWLFRNNLKVDFHRDWRLLAKYNQAISDSSQGAFFDGGYTEAVFGFAYRPVANDRLNALAKYTYFQNLPTTEVLSVTGTPAQFSQKSHIAALDATYELLPGLFTLGGKYAYRRGEVSLDRVDPVFFSNDAHLYIVRGDLRFLRNWETTAEGRLLHLPDLDERRGGALVGVYRYLGDHVKVGVGYNFTDFSTDLTDLSYDSQGWFFNIVGAL